jgi:hypothetical protein
MVGWQMNDELERIWKDVVVTYSDQHLLESNEETNKNLPR